MGYPYASIPPPPMPLKPHARAYARAFQPRRAEGETAEGPDMTDVAFLAHLYASYSGSSDSDSSSYDSGASGGSE